MKSSGIGGQAVIEGVMMKNKDVYAVAIRKPDKEIEVVERTFVATTSKNKLLALPFIRGVANFIDSLRIGISTLTYSSSFYEDDEDEKPSKFDEATKKLFKEKQEAVINGITIFVSFIIAILVFMVAPYAISRLLDKYISSQFVLNTIEGVIKMIIFLLYVILISRLEDIKRVFMYHGAEHKSINCIENGLPLTVANVKKSSRYHKRCGTSFLLFVILISIILFIFIRFDQMWLQLIARLLLIPVIAGVSYEILKLAGNSDNALVNAISKPGLWLQRLTTKEPDEDMIEVAIAAVEKVFDWKAYLEENAEEIHREAEEAFEFIDMEQIDKINSLNDIEELFEDDNTVYDSQDEEMEEFSLDDDAEESENANEPTFVETKELEEFEDVEEPKDVEESEDVEQLVETLELEYMDELVDAKEPEDVDELVETKKLEVLEAEVTEEKVSEVSETNVSETSVSKDAKAEEEIPDTDEVIAEAEVEADKDPIKPHEQETKTQAPRRKSYNKIFRRGMK